MRHAFADALDHTGKLAPGRERKGRLGLVLAGNDQRVEEIKPHCLDLGHDFAGRRHGLGNLGEHELVGRAKALAENGFHGARLFAIETCF